MSLPEPDASLAERPTRVRHAVLAFGVALAAVTYLDRVCIAQTSEAIQRDLGLSRTQMSYVFSAFTLAYALFEIPTGAWGDRIGARRVLTRIVVWWSAFTMATATAFNFASLLAIRFFFGAGEAGAWPNAARAFSRWFPRTERGTAQGIFFAGAHLGGGLTPLLVVALMQFLHWRTIFLLFGAVGFVWAAAWFAWFRDEPTEHPAANDAERKLILTGRTIGSSSHHFDMDVLGQLLSRRTLLALCVMYFTQTYGFYFLITWLPTYLRDVRGFETYRLGLLAGLPLVLSVLADLFGGIATDVTTRKRGPWAGRCGVGALSLLVAGAAIIAGARTDHAVLAALLISLAGASANFLLGAAWGTCLDIAGPHVGVVTACMNTAGQVGGVLSPIVFARFIDPERVATPDWVSPLVLVGGLYLLGAGCWLLVDPHSPLLGSTVTGKPAIEPLDA